MLSYFNIPAAFLGGSSAVVFGLSVEYMANARFGTALISILVSVSLSYFAVRSHRRNVASAKKESR